MNKLLPMVLIGFLVSVSAHARMVPETRNIQGPLYTDSMLRNFQVMDVKLGMTLSEAKKALGARGIRPTRDIIERRTSGSAKTGEEASFVGAEGEITLLYTKLTASPARVTGIFYIQKHASSTGPTLEERKQEIFAQYGSPSAWQAPVMAGIDPPDSFAWFSQERFRDEEALYDVRGCHTEWKTLPRKGSTCEEVLRRANSVELNIVLDEHVVLYKLYDYRAAYETLRTNVDFMKQARSARPASSMLSVPK